MHFKSNRTGIAVRILAGALIASLLPAAASAQPSGGSVADLRAKAARIADELATLDQQTSALDEDYNSANIELERLRSDLATNKADVAGAVRDLDDNRTKARRLAVAAFIGDSDRGLEAGIGGFSSDLTAASRRETYLQVRYGNSQDVIEGLTAATQRLAERQAALRRANDRVGSKLAELDKAKAAIQQAVAQRKAIQSSISGDLAAALSAEQARARGGGCRRQGPGGCRRPRRRSRRPPSRRRRGAGNAGSPLRCRDVSSGHGRTRAGRARPGRRPCSVRGWHPAGTTAVAVAMAQRGDPYVWGAAGPGSFDCSGLVMFAYRAAGRSLPHSSRSLRSMTRSISAPDLVPGDLVFGGSPVHHVGIYIGNGQMVHAPHSGDVVKVSSMYQTSKPVTFGRL
ncbi:MAG: NlpC/P60 family protein [Microthrixaceae bacterium]